MTVDSRFRRVNDLVLEEKFEEAVALLDETAELAAGVDRARALRLGAAVSRLAGELEGAVSRGRAAVAAADRAADPETLVKATTELGDALQLSGDTAAAVATWRPLIDYPPAPAAEVDTRAALLRKTAAALGELGQADEALELLHEAHALAGEAGDETDAARVAVQTVTLAQAGAHPETPALGERARRQAEAAGDHVALSDLALLDAAAALDRRDLDAALAAANQARRHALDAVAPLHYVSAAFATARVAEAAGDRVAAYESLAVGWVTLGDLLGPEVARETFAPELQRLRDKWGAPVFEATRSRYEERRRRELGLDAR